MPSSPSTAPSSAVNNRRRRWPQKSGAGWLRSNRNGFFSFRIFSSSLLTTTSTFSNLKPLYSDLTGAPAIASAADKYAGEWDQISTRLPNTSPPAAAVGGGGGWGREGERTQEKLVLALGPRRVLAAWSQALAASSAVSKVPSHLRVFFHGSRISAAKRPQGRFRTPRKWASLWALLGCGGGGIARASAGMASWKRERERERECGKRREELVLSLKCRACMCVCVCE